MNWAPLEGACTYLPARAAHNACERCVFLLRRASQLDVGDPVLERQVKAENVEECGSCEPAELLGAEPRARGAH